MKLPTDRTVFQNAWVVDDVEKTAMHWVKTMGIGPFFVGEYGPERLLNIKYRGKPAELRMIVGLAQAGPVQIEFIQPLSKGPNCYRDTVPVGTMAHHHLCVWTNDMEADLKYYDSIGCPTATEGLVKGGPRFAYVDTHMQLNCMVEILEHHPVIHDAFKMIAETAANWDGKDPIRKM